MMRNLEHMPIYEKGQTTKVGCVELYISCLAVVVAM
jgi:predicted NBD/HSP70 family sugar kinase